MNLFEVEPTQIARLEPEQLVRVLRQLLYLEAERHGIPRSATNVPLQISVPDGGEDGRIRWEGGPEKTDFLPQRFTILQSKAQKMNPAQCAKEVAPRNCLKPQVKEVLDVGGAYVQFCHYPYNTNLTESRVRSMREALRAAGRADWKTAYVEFYDANKIASWVNCFFPAQVYVLECNGITADFAIKSWHEWASHTDLQVHYVWNARLTGLIRTIRDTCHQESCARLRITGLSGLGKTRLALEAFRPIEGSDQYHDNALHHQVAYVDAALLENRRVVALLSQLVKLNRSGILVVDNCEPLLHRELVKELGYRGGEKISLVTLDFEPDESTPKWDSIALKADDCEGIVKGILAESFPGIGQPEISRIEEFAQGFASIAVLIAQQMADGVEDIGRISDAEIIGKLVGGRGEPDVTTRSVVTACSLFEHFEFSDETVTDHVAFIAQHIADVKPGEFFSVCTRILARGILQRRGRFARVCPIPLAITLAAHWLDEKPREQLVELVGRLKEEGLFEQFCNQLTKLSFCKNANQLVTNLIGVRGPFASPEALLTEEGSRLFRALVEVNPQMTTETLWRVLKEKSHDELLNIRDDIRRNLVWSLKNLCWWPGTFNLAARMMLSLAGAENETWGNNATGEFLGLFHVSLPGTEADLTARLDVVKEALASHNPETHVLGIRALGSALETQWFSRAYGPETQGSRAPRRDYNPKWKEAREYWASCITLLVEEIVGSGEHAKFAQRELAQQMRGLLAHRMIREVGNAVGAIVKARGKYWPEALAAIRNCLDYDLKDSPPEWRPQIVELEKVLLPESIEERLRLIVSVPDWRDREADDGSYVSVAAEEAEKLAEELSKDTSWYGEVGVLLKGEQRQANSFGKRLGELVERPQLFIDVCLDRLREIPSEEAVPELLGAFLGGVKDANLVATVMERIIADDKLVRFSVRITRCLDITEACLERLVPAIGNSRVPITDFGVFSYGRALDKIGEDFVSEFCDKLAAYSVEGARTALHILYMYCYGNEARFRSCSTSLRKLLMVYDLLATPRRESMLSHYWEVTSVKLISAQEVDTELAKRLVHTVVDIACEDAGGGSLSIESARVVLRVILKNYFAECWPIVGKALIEKRPRFLLDHILGMGAQKDEGPQNALLDALPRDGLVQWCHDNSPEGPAAITYIVPVFLTVKEPAWHPLAKRLIDEFGQVPEVLDNLSANMFSFASGGSRAPYHERRIHLLRELLDHVEPKVKAWAEKEITYHEKDRARELQRADEWKWGII
jgi:hypothetical protein